MNHTLDEQQLDAVIEAQAHGAPITAVPTAPVPAADWGLAPRTRRTGGGRQSRVF